MVYVLVIVIPVLLLLNIFLIYQNSNVIEYNKRLQDETEKIKVNTLDIIRTLHQIDMGLRGYALIDSKGQLSIATGGFVQMETVFDSLETSLSRQNFPMQSFRIMKDSIYLYFDVVREMISMVEERRMQEFNEVLEKNLGYFAYLSYVRFTNHVNTVEDKIAADARWRYNLALKNSYLLQIVIFFITVPALFYTVYLFNKSLKISEHLRLVEQKNSNMLASQKEELERQVQERTNEILAQNEEISTQNEEISAHNEQLVLQQDEIEIQRNTLAEKNNKLEEAYKTIEQQHHLIQEKNEALTREVNLQTRDLRKTNLELIEQNSRLEQFAYIISHNLRAPMTRLIGLSRILDFAKTEEEKNKIIQLMVKSTSEFDNVLQDLTHILDIQKLNTKVYSVIDLAEIMQKVLDMLENEINSTEAEIKTDFTKAPTLYSLPQYIDSIFYNLISNAIKYRHPDRPPVIIIKSRKANNLIQITVSDNGLGIDLSKHKEAVFNLYKRFHFHVEGKGLGLFLVRTQVEALGGQIKVESKLGVGTIFKIDFKKHENSK
jgi:signal transduction histidine kinase